MKKLISVLLVVSMIFSLVAVSVSAAEDDNGDIAFSVGSDLHFTFPDEELEWYSDDPIYGHANRRAAMENESGAIIDQFLKQCKEDPFTQFVLISGDLTNDGKVVVDEHYAMAEKLRKFEEESGKQVYVVPGNHDITAREEENDTPLKKFAEIYADFGCDLATDIDNIGVSYTADLSSKYCLIALDSTDPNRSTGDGMTDKKVEWVIEQAKKAYDEGKYPILMMHHNLLDHLPMQKIISKDFIIRDATATAEKWANVGIKVVFTGHEHCSDATTYTSTKGNLITDFATTSLTMYPLQYRHITMLDDEIRYRAETIEEINVDEVAAATNGYTEEQIALMKADINAFAKEYLKSGVQYRLCLGFTDEKLGIEEDAFYYDLVRDVLDTLIDNLDMPLYGDGSISEKAKKYDIVIPESDYENGWDVAMNLVAAHYEGSENTPLSSKDLTIFLRIVSVILKEENTVVEDEIFYEAAAAIIVGIGNDQSYDVLGALTGELNGVTSMEYMVLAILSPVLESFVTDDGVDDNNGVLDGYAMDSDKYKVNNVFENLSNSFKDIYSALELILNILLKFVEAWGPIPV